MKSSLSFLSLLLSVTAALTISACSNNSGGGGDSPREAPLDIDTQSCAFAETEGNEALFVNLETPKISKAAFEKEYNKALLDGVLEANVMSSIQFISQTGTTVYKADRAPTTFCSRDLFASAASLPADLSAEWNRVSNSVSKGNILLGLFLPPKSLPTNATKSALIMRVNTERWTLVHEFLHHLFNQKAEEAGITSDDQIKKYEALDRELENIDKTSKTAAEFYDRAGAMFPKMYSARDALLVSFTLEEVTIEKLMKDEYGQGRLRFVPPSTNGYLVTKADAAIKTYESYIKFARSILNGAPQHATAMDSLIRAANARIDEARTIKTKYPLHQNNLIAGRFEAETAHDFGCAHDQGVEDQLKKYDDLLGSR